MGKAWWRTDSRIFRFGWTKLVILLILLLASLQVLHMLLLGRLDEKNAKTHKERVAKSLQKDLDKLYGFMKDALENNHIVDSGGLYKVIRCFFQTESSYTETDNDAHFKRKSEETAQNAKGVTLVSQCSANHLVHLTALSQRWKGPISVAVFAADSQSVQAAINHVLFLYYCVPSMRHNVTIHLLYPLVTVVQLPEIRPTETSECSSLDKRPSHKLVQSRNYAFSNKAKYPNNLLRNVAISGAQTDYVFVVDIDMLPNSNLQSDFVEFSHRHLRGAGKQMTNEKTVFVVPAFELQNGAPVPQDKTALLELWRKREVRPFYYEMCWRCQRPTDYDAWRNLSRSSALSMAYEVQWKDPWEPFYIGPKSMPAYDERFRQYGFNRISQVKHLA